MQMKVGVFSLTFKRQTVICGTYFLHILRYCLFIHHHHQWHAPSGALLSSQSSSSQHDLVLTATRCADQCWQVSGRFQQFESISVLVTLEVVSSQQVIGKTRKRIWQKILLQCAGKKFQFTHCYI